ncbi:deoxyribodipyrimidine photo-lyase [Crateriforma conspicua]|uniref:Deoxyribodipyrimidine photo-lyase n=1 Tax=Crateriforma conspicua TaxID=2527996 RepID=A0A5C6G1T8_9PLAN|nr:deoxyribodipyrimidine photo-lyase [Crateriforma conspicua]TWU67133.1 deoxyribodipyrimidine photolyase [Crateriforma conspicua]
MTSRLIPESRTRRLNDHDPVDGKYVLYWMRHSQRSEQNHALEFAVRRANDLGKPLLVGVGIGDDPSVRTERQMRFQLEGLHETVGALQRRNIAMVVRKESPIDVAMKLVGDACEVVCDRGYLRHDRRWVDRFQREANRPVWQIESNVIVPVEMASDDREYAARTIRSQLQEAAEKTLDELATTPVDNTADGLSVNGIDLDDLDSCVQSLDLDHTVAKCDEFDGGTSQARSRLNAFLSDSLDEYRDDISVIQPHCSMLSPYLHFGQISPLKVALEVRQAGANRESTADFIEELLVRRELAINFVYFDSDYDGLDCLPDWARKTLEKHESDPRPDHYTASELEDGQTDDPVWNAAMTEMRCRGYLHNHLRMYWGKRILGWTNTIQHAYRVTLDLNNKYFYDGNDPNSYANVAWVFGNHDRAFGERDVFGKVRTMSASGLDRKIDTDAYVRSIAERFAASKA